jgi:hypothetical protein
MVSSPFQKAIDVIEALPPEDQEMLIDLIRRRLIESACCDCPPCGGDLAGCVGRSSRVRQL